MSNVGVACDVIEVYRFGFDVVREVMMSDIYVLASMSLYLLLSHFCGAYVVDKKSSWGVERRDVYFRE